jgi:hypothetical protein
MENLQEKKKYSDRKVIDYLIGGFCLHLYHKLTEMPYCSKQNNKDQPEIKNLTPEEKEFRSKIKFFKLTIKKGFFGSRQIWEMRDKPLSDQELDDFFKIL